MSSRTSKPNVGIVKNAGKDGAVLDLPPIPANVAKNLTPEQLMKFTFKLMMDTGDYVDTKFYAYSRRKAAGAVYAPKAVYANSYILRARAPEYFEPCMPRAIWVHRVANLSCHTALHGQYDGYSMVGPLSTGFPDEFPDEIDGSGFESDSDIEDDDDQESAAPSSIKDTPKQTVRSTALLCWSQRLLIFLPRSLKQRRAPMGKRTPRILRCLGTWDAFD